MSKFLFFDIDGTLVGKSRHITEKTKEAINNPEKSFVAPAALNIIIAARDEYFFSLFRP